MAPTKKLHREPLPDDLTKALLADPLAEILGNARKTLQKAVQQAREHIENSPLTPIVAQSVMKDLGRRGEAAVIVDDNGEVLLEIRYKGIGNKNTRTWTSDLPSLVELRRQAKEKNVDISHLGRNRREIVALLRDS